MAHKTLLQRLEEAEDRAAASDALASSRAELLLASDRRVVELERASKDMQAKLAKAPADSARYLSEYDKTEQARQSLVSKAALLQLRLDKLGDVLFEANNTSIAFALQVAELTAHAGDLRGALDKCVDSIKCESNVFEWERLVKIALNAVANLSATPAQSLGRVKAEALCFAAMGGAA